jgi:hypothetical protein
MTMHQSSSHFSSNPSLQISSMPTSPLSVQSIPAFSNDGLDPTQASLNRLQPLIDQLDSSLRLPNNPRAFMVYLLGLMIVFAGGFLHVLIAAQIMQAEFTLNQLQEEYRAIEQQNGDIIFQIARDTNIARLQERVLAQGYVPVQEREYVFVPNASIANTAANTAPLTENSSETSADVTTSVVAQPPAATISSGNVDAGHVEIGQVGRWEEFWSMTWRSATGSRSPSPSDTTANTTSSHLQRSKDAPDFWSAWWEEASARGSKLLDQFRGQ